MSFAEVKALASGDPLILDKARADAEVMRLARLERAWQRTQPTLRYTIAGAEDRARALEDRIHAVNRAIGHRQDTHGDRFQMIVDGRHVSSRADAATLLARRLQQLPYGQRIPLGELGGLPIDAEIRADHKGLPLVELALHGLSADPATLERGRLAASSLSLVRQLEHRIEHLPDLAARLHDQHDQALREAASAREQLHRPFKYERQLAAARQQQAQIEKTITERHAQTAAPEPSPADASCIEPRTADSLRLLQATQAHSVEDALHTPPAAPVARPSPPRTRSPSARPRR